MLNTIQRKVRGILRGTDQEEKGMLEGNLEETN